MPRLLPRSLSRLLLALVATSAIAATALPMTAAAADLTPDQARSYVLRLINQERAKLHLVPVLPDARVADVAQARSDDMAQNHYFAHLPDSQLIAMFDARHITWYSIGEILRKDDYPTLADSAAAAMEAWRGSPTHWNIITSASFNYAGVGLSIEPGTNDNIWTVEFLRGPDRTGARAWFTSVAPGSSSSTTQHILVAWAGKDVPLSALTAGLKNFQLQKRIDGGKWTVVLKSTTVRHTTMSVAAGRKLDVRIRARDKAGNYGAWVIRAALP